jgi:hypothetical protein
MARASSTIIWVSTSPAQPALWIVKVHARPLRKETNPALLTVLEVARCPACFPSSPCAGYQNGFDGSGVLIRRQLGPRHKVQGILWDRRLAVSGDHR